MSTASRKDNESTHRLRNTKTTSALLPLALVAGSVGTFMAVCGRTDEPSNAWQPEKMFDCKHLHNVLRISRQLYAGGEPHNDAAFAELAEIGVKTIVSVDGARPDVQAAGKHGLRYIHIPIGYGVMEEDAVLSLSRVGQELQGPVYVHCHHGRHRGPAAAAVVYMASGRRPSSEARRILEVSKTSREYAGLWRSVEQFTPPPDDDTELPELVETAHVESLAAAMAKIDRRFDTLRQCSRNSWRTPTKQPDLVPGQEALALYEGLRESHRQLSGDYDKRFRMWLDDAANDANLLYEALKSDNRAIADRRFDAIQKSCTRCHKAYRN